MAVKDAYTFDVLAGVGADDEKQFIALNMEIDFPKGTATQMEAYIIPSIMQHFYLSVNNGSPVPASKATWLASEPLSTPGNESVTIEKETKNQASWCFMPTNRRGSRSSLCTIMTRYTDIYTCRWQARSATSSRK